MGIAKTDLPDAVLRRISPADRAAAGLPGPVAVSVAVAVTANEHRREKELQSQIVNWLRLRSITVLWSRTDKRLTATVGCPDLTFAVNGRAVALECKLPGCQPTEDQVRVMTGLMADGWLVRICHSLDEARSAVAEAEWTK